MAKYLFDANAVVDLINAGEYDLLFDEATLDLMFYEAANTFWRHSAVEQSLSRTEGGKFVSRLEDLRTEMAIYSVDETATIDIYETAWDTSLTVYDAAYVTVAEQNDLQLVANDRGIHDHAPENVTVLDSDSLEE